MPFMIRKESYVAVNIHLFIDFLDPSSQWIRPRSCFFAASTLDDILCHASIYVDWIMLFILTCNNRHKNIFKVSIFLFVSRWFEIHVERSWNNPSLQGKKIGCNYAYEPSVSIFPRIFRSDLEERELLLVPFDVKVDKEEFLCLPPYLSSFKNDFMQHSFRNFLHMHKRSLFPALCRIGYHP
ncbi:yippee-like isoform X1 [Megachile rotundata]|uniref:yippee-like isoform X1 n=1 Tax=Megachile rotundata TaxID=143995 RepID=UPI003FD65B69